MPRLHVPHVLPASLLVAATSIGGLLAPTAALAWPRAERVVERRLARILGPEAAAAARPAQPPVIAPRRLSPRAAEALGEALAPRPAPPAPQPRLSAPPVAPQPRAATAARAPVPTPSPPRRLAAPGPATRLKAARPAAPTAPPAPPRPVVVDAAAAAMLLAGRTPPFTAAWYAEHPQAWRHEKPDTDWWRPLDPDALVAWLDKPRFAGGAAAPGVWTIDEPAEAGVAADGTRSVLVNADEPAADESWQPLGVFAAAPAGVARPLALQQLAVSRDGVIRGNHLDAVSGAVQPISGTLDAAGRRASWTVGVDGARFEAGLDALAEPTATATVQGGGGGEAWSLARLENPQAARPTVAPGPVELLPSP